MNRLRWLGTIPSRARICHGLMQDEPTQFRRCEPDVTQTVRLPADAPLPPGPTPLNFEPGQRLGPVTLVREIGRGGMGAVWLGQHQLLGRPVAVKFLLSNESHDAFLKEARAASALRHANLVQVHHADIHLGRPYLVMEHIAGPSLRQLLSDLRSLDVPALLLVLQDVADGVDALHAQGMIHRDLKPANILLDRRGTAMVADFGLALRRPQGAGAGPAPFAGTPSYMAPECFAGEVSTRSDMYALGIVAFELLTGHLPFGGNWQALHENGLPASVLSARGLDAAAEVIGRAVHSRPRFRYKTGADLVRALAEASGQPQPSKIAAPTRQARLAALLDQARDPMAVASGAFRPPQDGSSSGDFRQTIERLSMQKREQRERLAPPAIASSQSGREVVESQFPGMPCAYCGHDMSGLTEFDRCPDCGSPVVESIRPAAVAPWAWPGRRLARWIGSRCKILSRRLGRGGRGAK